MRDSHRGVRRVDALAALTRRTVDVDSQIGFVDLDRFDLFGLGVDEHAGRRCVHAALRLGDRHALHAMHSALELEPRPHTVGRVALAPDRQGRVLVAAEVRDGLVEHRDSPAVPLGVSDVHARQVGGEQCRLLAALAGLDLEHDVVGVVRVTGCEQIGQLGVELLDGGLQLGDLRGERLVVGGRAHGPPRGRLARPPACGRSQRSVRPARTAGRPCGRRRRRHAGWGRRVDARGRQARPATRRSPVPCRSCRPPSRNALQLFIAERKPTPGLRSHAESGVANDS